jgi:WD40 repeat protein
MRLFEQFYKLTLRVGTMAIASSLIALGEEGGNFERTIGPLLRQNCQACHRVNRAEGGLSLETRESILQGGDSGIAIDLKHPEASLLLERVRSTDPDSQMPPPGNSVGARRLSESQTQQLEEWLRKGALFDTTKTGSLITDKSALPGSVRTSYTLEPIPLGASFAFSRGNEIVMNPFDSISKAIQPSSQTLGVAHQDACYALGVCRMLATENQSVPALSTEPIAQSEVPGPPDSETKAVLETLKNVLIGTGSTNEAKIWRITGNPDVPALEWIATVDAQNGRHISERVNAIAFSPLANRLAIGSGLASRTGHLTVFAIDRTTPSATASLDTIRMRELFIAPESHSDTILAIAFSPDGKTLATGSADKFVKIYKTDSWTRMRKLEGHTHHILSLVWHHEGKLLVTASADGTIKVWDTIEGQSTRTITLGKEVTDVAFVGKTNRFVSSAIDGVVRLNDVTSNDVIRSFVGAKDALHSVAVSADEKTVVAVGEEGLPYRWNIEDGKLIEAGSTPAASTIQQP